MDSFSPRSIRLDLLAQKIRMSFSYPTYKKGLDYFQRGAIQDLHYNKNQNIWIADVQGTDLYRVIIQFNQDDMGYRCSCPANEKYNECKHTVAALLQIHDILEANPDTDKYPLLKLPIFGGKPNYASQLIELFTRENELGDSSIGTLQKTLLRVEYLLKAERDNWGSPPLLKVELKIGVERPFVVKNIHQFLRHLKEGTTLPFTKSFTFDPNRQTFEASDLEIFKLLQDITEGEHFFNQTRLGTDSLSARGLTLPPVYADQVLERLQPKITSFITEDLAYSTFHLKSGPLPLSFELHKKDTDYELNTESFKHYTYLPELNYLLNENTFYKMSKTQKKMYEKFRPLFRNPRFSQVEIPSDEIEGFLAHVLPGLKKIGHLQIDPRIAENILAPTLKTKVFLDLNDDQLTAKLEYHYGDVRVSPFSDKDLQNEGKFLLRDIDKENAILPYLEEAQFQKGHDLFYIQEEEAIFHFLYDVLPLMEKEAEVYMTDAAQGLIFDNPTPPKIKVDFESNENWLDISFDFKDIEESDIQHFLKSVVEKKHYVRLPSGAFIPLQGEQFHQVSELFTELQLKPEDYQKGHINLPAFRGLQVDEVLDGGPSKRYNRAFKDLIEAMKEPETREEPLPSGLEATLRDYQWTGYQWFKSLSTYHFGGILADDMGLGKTIQTIAYLLSERKTTNEPALVVAPASLIYNWKQECKKFAPSLHTLVVSGSKTERQALIERVQADQVDVVITSYPLLRQDIERYRDHRFSSLILDEAQAIKNHTTQTAKAVKTIQATHRFALSGTPIENALDELWSIFEAIMPGFFPNKKSFNALTQEKTARMTRPFILRRLKRDVLKELPDKIETVQTSELTEDQKKLYLGYLEKIQGETASALATEGFQKNRMKILAGLTRLRQLCCHPALFLENYEGTSGKLTQLLDLIETSRANGQRLLIFSQFSSMLKIIQSELKKQGQNTFYLDGETPSKLRVEMAERFNQGEGDLFLISLKAGGTGLNLTGADTVILYDLWWNPAIEEQAAGRAHRIGQKKVVQVIRLITEGTIEEKIYELQQKKKELIDSIIQPGETMLSSLSENDIRELLKI